MQRQISKMLSVIVSATFAALAISAVTVPTVNAQGKVTKEYCKTHQTDPRCKGMSK
jgi:hypothetical protein